MYARILNLFLIFARAILLCKIIPLRGRDVIILIALNNWPIKCKYNEQKYFFFHFYNINM